MHRHERAAPAAGRLQVPDRREPDLRLAHEHAAEPIAERRLDRDLELLGRAHDIGDHAADRLGAFRLRDLVRALHHRTRAAREALVAIVDLAQRGQPRRPAVHLGAQRLDLGLAARDLVCEQIAPGLEVLVLAAEVELGLAERRELAGHALGLAIEVALALAVHLGLGRDALEAALRLVAAADQRLELRIRGRDLGPPRAELAARAVEPALRARVHLPRLARRGLARHDLGGLALDIGRELRELRLPRGQLLGAARALFANLVDLRGRLRDAAVEVARLAALEVDLAVAEANAVIELVDDILHAEQPALLDRQLRALRDHVGILGHERGAHAGEILARGIEPRRNQLRLAAQLEPAMRRLPQLDVARLRLVLAEALGLLGLAAQRAHPLVELADDVRHAHEVLARLIELLLGGLLLRLELGDARRLFDDRTTILRPAAHDLADTALLDDRVRLGANAGAEEEVGDVAQAARRLVDEVLRGAVAVQAPRDRDLGEALEVDRGRRVGEQLGDLVLRRRDRVALGVGPGRRGGRVFGGRLVLAAETFGQLLDLRFIGRACELEGLVREADVVERQRDLGHRRRTARLRAGEDDVLHRLAAQVLGALLAHAPADRIDDVRLAATVRADDGGDRRIERQHRAIAERLEPDDLDSLDAHVPVGEPAPGV